MCQFFSCISNGQGKIFYFDWNIRKRILSGELEDYQSDSHTSIADYFRKNEDRHNKYEFNPFTKKFTIDQINVKDDSENVKKQLLRLDFTTIVPSLRIKEISNPLLIPQTEVTMEVIDLLHKWDSIRNSVWSSVVDSVVDSVGSSVWSSVGSSVWSSVVDSVGGSVWSSVVGSVVDSVQAQIGSYFTIETWRYAEKLGSNPWYPNNRLWELGFVPSFDGKTWRLHSGPNAVIVYEWIPNK